jgi:Flp pilus assembly protein TadD
MRSHGTQWQVIAAVLAFVTLAGAAGTAVAADSKSKRAPRSQPVPEQVDDFTDPKLSDSVNAERALERKPNDRATHLRAARAYMAEGGDKESNVVAAQGHVVAVLAQSPNDIDALLLAGQTSLLRNDAGSAARYYRAATTAGANNATAFLGLGDALTRLGDEAGANAAFARYRALMNMPPLQAPAVKK